MDLEDFANLISGKSLMFFFVGWSVAGGTRGIGQIVLHLVKPCLAEIERGGCKGGPRLASTRQRQDHNGALRSGTHARQTKGAIQGDSDDPAQSKRD